MLKKMDPTMTMIDCAVNPARKNTSQLRPKIALTRGMTGKGRPSAA
jgi:hypothetical protein